MPGSRPRSRAKPAVKPSVRSRTFSRPMIVEALTYAASDSPVASRRIAARCWWGRCWWIVSPPWSVGV